MLGPAKPPGLEDEDDEEDEEDAAVEESGKLTVLVQQGHPLTGYFSIPKSGD